VALYEKIRIKSNRLYYRGIQHNRLLETSSCYIRSKYKEALSKETVIVCVVYAWYSFLLEGCSMIFASYLSPVKYS